MGTFAVLMAVFVLLLQEDLAFAVTWNATQPGRTIRGRCKPIWVTAIFSTPSGTPKVAHPILEFLSDTRGPLAPVSVGQSVEASHQASTLRRATRIVRPVSL